MINIMNDLIEQFGESIKSFIMFKFFLGIKILVFVNQVWKKDRDREIGKLLEDLQIYREIEIQRFQRFKDFIRDLKIQGFINLEIYRFRELKIQRIRDLKINRFKEILRFKKF